MKFDDAGTSWKFSPNTEWA
ncbi:hypothetical protein CGLO_17023 [Colletotrichum gloeosporioides Cg-14]|uniref:Uncharacterized protein n=1 Tax=Colletotrichum gloeosporioides (strain Cg-14) TaxID=1237896 RepID=T0JXL8_COLGC|nr:hypothetical protein CGLO_17023 [Colletotrichum gloeosporioides Cg-14]